MSRLTAHLRYFVIDAWDECRRSPWPNLLAAGTLAGVLFVAGLALLVFRNAEHRIARWQQDVRVEVYLREGIAPETLEGLRARAGGLPGVARVEYVDKAEALRRYRAGFPATAELSDELGTNPLPASLELVLAPGGGAMEQARTVAAALERSEGVEEVRFDAAWLERLASIVEAVRRAGFVLGLVVFGATVLVMAGVLRLAVYARRDEADIMLLVGASVGFVRGPYLVGGLAQGLAASAAAIVAVEAVRRTILLRADSSSIVHLVAGSALDLAASGALVATGLTVGFVSAWFAVRASSRPGA